MFKKTILCAIAASAILFTVNQSVAQEAAAAAPAEAVVIVEDGGSCGVSPCGPCATCCCEDGCVCAPRKRGCKARRVMVRPRCCKPAMECCKPAPECCPCEPCCDPCTKTVKFKVRKRAAWKMSRHACGC